MVRIEAKRRLRIVGSLGRWLTVLFLLASILPLLASNIIGYLRARDIALRSARREVRETAGRAAADVGAFVREAHGLLPSLISGNDHLRATTRALLLPTSVTAQDAYRQALHIHLVAKSTRSAGRPELTVLSSEGRVLASSNTEVATGDDWSQSQCVSERVVTDVTLHEAQRTDQVWVLLVSSPVHVGVGVPSAILCANFSLAGIELSDTMDQIPGTRLVLTERNGRLLADTLPPPLDHLSQQPARLGAAQRALMLRGLARTVDGRYASTRGEMLAAFSPIALAGWGVLVEIPVAAALAELERLKWQAFWGSIALSCLLILVILVFARAVSDSLSAISIAAGELARGNLGQLVGEQDIAELGQLAAAFNEMSAALRASHDGLESKIAERTAALERSLAFTNLLLDSIDHHVVVVDRSGTIVRVNSSATAAYGSWLLGAPFRRICDNPSPTLDGGATTIMPAGCENSAVGRTFRTGQPDRAERALQLASGPQIVQLQTWPIAGDDGVEAVVEIGRVVTDERQTRAQMMHQEKMAAFGLLAAGVAHEIGNPLAAIDSQLQLARMRADPKTTERTLDVVRSQVDRIGRLLRDLVDFSRKKRDVVTRVSLFSVTEDVCRLLGHDSRSRGITVRNDIAPDLVGVSLLEDHMVQVLLNLAMNALDAMGQGGELRFTAEADDDVVTLRVSDTGGGIDMVKQAQVFAPFFTTKPAGKGTGLGLFVSRNVVSGFGGHLRLESSRPGLTVFSLTVPLQSSAAQSTPSQTAPSQPLSSQPEEPHV